MTILSKTFIKEDRNHAKYFAVVEACPACAGTGNLPEYYMIDGGICYTCKGSGIHCYNDKEYTPEYEAKLRADRLGREEKAQAIINADVEKYLSGESKIYFGKYNHKSILEVAEENYSYLLWLATRSSDAALSIACSKIVEDGEEARLEERAAKLAELQYVGKAGDKIQVEVTLEKEARYETQYGLMILYKFKDVDGNILVWNTSTFLCRRNVVDGCEYSVGITEGETVTINATIKSHSEYNGEKQTVITRVKLV